jgi:hypothetical protein
MKWTVLALGVVEKMLVNDFVAWSLESSRWPSFWSRAGRHQAMST